MEFVSFIVLNRTFLTGLVEVNGEVEFSKTRFHPCLLVGSQVIVALRESIHRLEIVFSRVLTMLAQNFGISEICKVKSLAGEEVFL